MNNPYPSMFPPMDQPPPAANHILLAKLLNMFTIEHTFDCSVITLVDEGQAPLTEDVIVNVFEDSITVTQYDPRTEQPVRIALSLAQVRDLGAALDLPEGVYRLRPETGADE